MYKDFVELVREIYGTEGDIPLHEPRFVGIEKDLVLDSIESTRVSTIGEYVDRFEEEMGEFLGGAHAVATVNGTSALHIALVLAGVEQGDEVITQSLTFVATGNAIAYCGAQPVFVDVEKETLSLSPDSLASYLEEFATPPNEQIGDVCLNKISNRRITACVPMHTFGHPARIDEINALCKKYKIKVIEDGAESLGSTYRNQHMATTSEYGIISLNGNKIITSGGGGFLVCRDQGVALKAKHLTTTAKKSHGWKFGHDFIGFNYRMPNINAALGVAQLESLPYFIKAKRKLAVHYKEWFELKGIRYVDEPKNSSSNYWLNSIILDDIEARDRMLSYTNQRGVMTRPVWTPLHQLDIYSKCCGYDLNNTEWLAERIINIPSSVPLDA